MQIISKILSRISGLIKRSKTSDQSPVKKKRKRNADGMAICIIHVVANPKDKVSGFTEPSWKVQPQCFRIYYMHDLLWVLTFQVVYIVCILSKLFISAFSYVYGSVFKLKMVDITVECKTSSHIYVDEYLISEALMIKHSPA